MKHIMMSLAGAALTLSIAAACQSSAAPTGISKIPSTPPQTETAHVDDNAPRIGLADAKKDFDAGTAVFVDTRDASAFNLEHIKGAINVPASELKEKIKTIPSDKKIIAYCS